MNEATHAGRADLAGIPRRDSRVATRLAWSMSAVCVVLIASSLLLTLLTPAFLVPVERPDTILVVSSGLLSLATPIVAALVASRLPRNPIGWVFCAVGLLFGVWRLAIAYADCALLAWPWLPWGEHAAWLSTWLGISGLILAGVFLVLLFPDGRLPSRRWRPVAWAAIGGAAMVAIGEALRFGPLPAYYYVQNPFGIAGDVGGLLPAYQLLEASSIVGGGILSAGCLASIVALALRLRRTSGEEREPLRWFAYAAVPALVGSIVVLVDWSVQRFGMLVYGKTVWPILQVAQNVTLFVQDDRAVSRLTELRVDATLDLLTVSALLLVPVCTGVAIVNHRLYDITLPTRAIVRSLRVLLAGVAAGLLPFVFVYLTVYAYIIFYPTFGRGDLTGRIEPVVELVSGWGARAFFLIATVLLASWVARKVEERAVLYGTLVGLLAVVIDQTVTSFSDPPVAFDELVTYLVLGVAGGWLAGVASRTDLSKNVYRASRWISRSGNAAAVAAAIGEHVGGTGVYGVALWRDDSGRSGTGGTAPVERVQDPVLWGSWTPADENETWSSGAHRDVALVSALARLGNRPWIALRTARLPAAERAFWERRGVRLALLIPLIAPGDARIGTLMATFLKRRRLSRKRLRAYLTLAVQAALALENIRLVEEAQQTGRQTGILVERQRLAREIHDTLAQGFTGVITNLTAVEMAKDFSATDKASTRYLEDAMRIARESLAEARRLIWALRPESLDRFSLSEALDRFARNWSEQTGVEVRITTSGTSHQLLPEAEIALLRAAQEALANVHKHAQATRVNLTLSYMEDRVILDVLDDGAGFDPAGLKTAVGAQDESGFGLTAMRERIEQLGGTLLIETTPGEGTAIVVNLPVATEGQELTSQRY